MNRYIVMVGLILTIVSFYFYILSLMNIFPIWISVPFLFGSLCLTLSPLAVQKRFKGFR
ncbi:hypothetical protein [Halalkalibacter krulwichiae]|uniref:hypothetical protein n=1 Tax=Halalkalibacter krulwichiae TaxID=199441 RepID=UPI000AA7F615|nr:hypothetical protein [Halalkalibacter krulwichiae]